jgi:hypothetical protein
VRPVGFEHVGREENKKTRIEPGGATLVSRREP